MAKTTDALGGHVRLIVTIGIAVLGATTWFWWQNVYTSPKNVFERMLINSLQTTSYAKLSSQSDQTQGIAVESLQTLAPTHQVHSLNTLKQGVGTTISTENITTPDKNFVRYTSILTDQTSSDGQSFDFSTVIGVWGEATAGEGNNSATQLYTQNIVIPFSWLDPTDRQALLRQIKDTNVYETDYSSVETISEDNRQFYIYKVVVRPVPYINMLKDFNNMLGLSQLDDIDATSYENVAPLNFIFKIDVLSAQLAEIAYSSGNTESFTSFGAIDRVQQPDEAVPLEELQIRLQQIQ